MTLLVVDDDRNILDLMSAILPSLGYEDFVCAQSGEEALTLIQDNRYQFSTFFLDIQMPGMDGIELCGRIRATLEHRNTPVIMLTAMKDKAHVDAAFLRGATDYLTKPIDTTELGARLRVAQLLYAEQQRSQDATRREQILRLGMNSAADAEMRFELADPIAIYDVPRVIGSLQLENYLYRLSRIKRFMFGAIGFQIEKPESLFALTSPLEFHGILTDVAEAIFEVLRNYDVIISYVGNGQYVAILPRTLQFEEEELELSLSMTLREFGLIGGETVPMDISVKVGKAVRMSMFDANPQTLIARALAQTDSKGHRSKNTFLVA
ncbi:response regulator [Celeribacter persicus]|jgi:Response regulators consisting of a CheY-like receiver domain and a winged-helix DNA-binding domain|uniref:Response regulator receiver domain-containing protein n=1 Tax=Celeribacter persicus TaxID=1651082 RepID=A0A2T5H9U1_9RHOB|nr:response regulator [Celeribacter persicus]PTQ68339.1 response regulator receiver domain-containing protein [Celeribacter persicus]